jgi:hypothetical protein
MGCGLWNVNYEGGIILLVGSREWLVLVEQVEQVQEQV